MNNELIAKHRAWMNREKDQAQIDALEKETECPACEKCGCVGNETCGHEAIDREDFCAMSYDLICPCCHEVMRRDRPQ